MIHRRNAHMQSMEMQAGAVLLIASKDGRSRDIGLENRNWQKRLKKKKRCIEGKYIYSNEVER